MVNTNDCGGLGPTISLPNAIKAATEVLVFEGYIEDSTEFPETWWTAALHKKVTVNGELKGAYFRFAPINAGRHGVGHVIIKTSDFDRRVLRMFEAEKKYIPKSMKMIAPALESAIDDDLGDDLEDIDDDGEEFEGFNI